MISAQETTPGQEFSKDSLISSITSYDLSESIFEREFFSPNMVGVSSSNNEPSQPCQYINYSQSQKQNSEK